MARPTLGHLLDLCDENYRLLSRLVPGLAGLAGEWVLRSAGSPELCLSVVEQTPYTTLFHLGYRFSAAADLGDPHALLRAYHDARQLELLELRRLPPQLDFVAGLDALEAKWRVNLFLGKWLRYCCEQQRRFGPVERRYGASLHAGCQAWPSAAL